MLEVDRLTRVLPGFEMRDVTFSVDAGEYFVLLGASGTGKSVLLETLTGIQRPDSGRVVLGGRDITHERIQKRRIALVFQDRALFPHMTVEKNVAYGLSATGSPADEIRRKVAEVAARSGIGHLLGRRPPTLSGGEAQRVALARAVVTSPELLLLDEPVSSVDVPARDGLRDLLSELSGDGMTVVHVTHEFEEAVSLATSIGIMEGGRIIQTGSASDVLADPASEFAARFVGIRNIFRGEVRSTGGAGPVLSSDGLEISVPEGRPSGTATALVRSEDVFLSPARPETSARNVFEGTVAEIRPARWGYEVLVTPGKGPGIWSLITARSAGELGVEKGKRVFASFKAGAVRLIPGRKGGWA